MVELTYTSVLGADVARIEGLNPSYGTNLVWVGSLAVRSGRACARYHPLCGDVKSIMYVILGSLERVQRAFVSRVHVTVAQMVEQQANCAPLVQVQPVIPMPAYRVSFLLFGLYLFSSLLFPAPWCMLWQ